ncbi:hypothetical protein COU57_00195 [Candidatus Pacearchaeota archaeon CG10_big_fil_rev_8_21_14_0_10_32_14]|nr:MAG: hypothetical protein COU57_00195 [Candidatus Pacearchaeota archaeon CG10_big_fil_rev_8_21_14_0_10_32_14]
MIATQENIVLNFEVNSNFKKRNDIMIERNLRSGVIETVNENPARDPARLFITPYSSQNRSTPLGFSTTEMRIQNDLRSSESEIAGFMSAFRQDITLTTEIINNNFRSEESSMQINEIEMKYIIENRFEIINEINKIGEIKN